MKIAMFAWEFAPVNTTGNYRNTAFAKILSQEGLEIHVFTICERDGQEIFGRKIDENLLIGTDEIHIYRYPVRGFRKVWKTRIGNAIRIWWSTTDKIDRRWFRKGTKRHILLTLNQIKPDYLYFSLPPFSMARVALEIHKITGIPYIVDMRDAWSLWCTSPNTSYIHFWYKRKLELKLFSSASSIITVTEELKNDFVKHHPRVDESKFNVIFNGLDKIDIPIEDNTDKSVFKIGYVGSFYYSPENEKLKRSNILEKRLKDIFTYTPRHEDWSYRSPLYFFKAIELMLEENPELRMRISIEYVGAAPSWLSEMVEKFGIQDIFFDVGFLDKDEVVRRVSTWSAILATSEKVLDGRHYCLPSKIFDIVNSRKRILAFVTEGSQKSFLSEYPQTTFFDPDCVKINSELLRYVILNNTKIPALPVHKKYFRNSQGLSLLKLLRELKK